MLIIFPFHLCTNFEALLSKIAAHIEGSRTEAERSGEAARVVRREQGIWVKGCGVCCDVLASLADHVSVSQMQTVTDALASAGARDAAPRARELTVLPHPCFSVSWPPVLAIRLGVQLGWKVTSCRMEAHRNRQLLR